MKNYVEKISHYYESMGRDEIFPLINSKELVNQCARKVWATLRRVRKRPFNIYQARVKARRRMEVRQLLEECRALGWMVNELHPKTNRPIEFMEDGLHVQMSAVGRATDDEMMGWFLIEAEPVSDGMLSDVMQGKIVQAYPALYAHCQLGMGYSKINQCIVVLSSPNGAIYMERVGFCEGDFLRFRKYAQQMYAKENPPAKEEGVHCQGCFLNEACYDMTFVPNVVCQTCIHAKLETKGIFCQQWGKEVGPEVWVDGCAEHVFIPELLNFTASYKKKDLGHCTMVECVDVKGRLFNLGGMKALESESVLTSKEVKMMGSGVLDNEVVMQIKQEFAGSKIISQKGEKDERD